MFWMAKIGVAVGVVLLVIGLAWHRAHRKAAAPRPTPRPMAER